MPDKWDVYDVWSDALPHEIVVEGQRLHRRCLPPWDDKTLATFVFSRETFWRKLLGPDCAKPGLYVMVNIGPNDKVSEAAVALKMEQATESLKAAVVDRLEKGEGPPAANRGPQ